MGGWNPMPPRSMPATAPRLPGRSAGTSIRRQALKPPRWRGWPSISSPLKGRWGRPAKMRSGPACSR